MTSVDYSGWLNGTHPEEGTTKNATVCFSYDTGNGDNCHWSQEIQITNCFGLYYVYYLPKVPTCAAKYCAE